MRSWSSYPSRLCLDRESSDRLCLSRSRKSLLSRELSRHWSSNSWRLNGRPSRLLSGKKLRSCCLRLQSLLPEKCLSLVCFGLWVEPHCPELCLIPVRWVRPHTFLNTGYLGEISQCFYCLLAYVAGVDSSTTEAPLQRPKGFRMHFLESLFGPSIEGLSKVGIETINAMLLHCLVVLDLPPDQSGIIGIWLS